MGRNRRKVLRTNTLQDSPTDRHAECVSSTITSNHFASYTSGHVMSRATAEQSKFSDDYLFAATHPGVLGNPRPPITNRKDLDQCLVDRCCHDPALRRSLIEHPRAIYAVAVEESFGIHRSLFFIQIRQVKLIAEDESVLGVVLTACHLGCVAPRIPTGDERATSQCHICNHGKDGCDGQMDRPLGRASRRDQVRDWIQNRAKVDDVFRDQLIASPSQTWSELLESLALPVDHPLRAIRSIALFTETSETIGLVLRHEFGVDTGNR